MLPLMAAVCLTFTSCGDDDDDESGNEPGNTSVPELLYGSWEETLEECFKDEQLVKSRNRKHIYTFSKDGILTQSYYGGRQDSYSGKFTFKDNHIIATTYYPDGRVWDALNDEVLELDATTLTLKSPYPDYEYDYTVIHFTRR